MVEKVSDSPEIFRISVTLPHSPLRNLNSYVIRTPEQSLVIDTGMCLPECRKELWEGICELGLDMARTSLFLTHYHPDHTGLAADFATFGCTVYMEEEDYDTFRATVKEEIGMPLMDLYRKEGIPEADMKLLSAGVGDTVPVPKTLFPVTYIRDGDRIPLGEVEAVCIHTPGHSPGHMALYLPGSQVLFSGDHILFDISPNITAQSECSNELGNFLSSLRKVRLLPIKMTLPAHRSTCHKDVYERIDELLAHHENRMNEVLRAVAAHPGATAYYIAEHISWSGMDQGWDQFPPNQKWFAMGETLSHLYCLVHAGKVIRSVVGSRITYHPVTEGESH